MKLASPGRARAAGYLAMVGLAYIGVLFVLACIVLIHGIPDETVYYLHRVPAEVDTFARLTFWGLAPLLVVLIVILVLARTSHAPDESRLAYMLLVIGLPLAVVAYFVWYRLGW